MLYANPSIDGGGDISVRDLKVANEFVDIWQPHLGLVEYVGAGTFGKFAKPWWFYSNPESPTKSASPLGDYRGLFWIAWNLGASGLGFWSYSDTSGSSAWNDFDGRRPDWAVVYESNTAPISSRRWAAFKEGREDYALLQSLTGQSRDRLQKMVSSRDVTTWTSNDYARARRAAFDAANSGKNPR